MVATLRPAPYQVLFTEPPTPAPEVVGTSSGQAHYDKLRPCTMPNGKGGVQLRDAETGEWTDCRAGGVWDRAVEETVDTAEDVASAALEFAREWILRGGAILAGIALLVVAIILLYKSEGGK